MTRRAIESPWLWSALYALAFALLLARAGAL